MGKNGDIVKGLYDAFATVAIPSSSKGDTRGKMKATGALVDAQFAHVWELQNGKIIRFQRYTDTRRA